MAEARIALRVWIPRIAEQRRRTRSTTLKNFASLGVLACLTCLGDNGYVARPICSAAFAIWITRLAKNILQKLTYDFGSPHNSAKRWTRERADLVFTEIFEMILFQGGLFSMQLARVKFQSLITLFTRAGMNTSRLDGLLQR